MFNLLKILFDKKTLPLFLSEQEQSKLLKLNVGNTIEINNKNFIIKKINILPNSEKHYIFDNYILNLKNGKINFLEIKPTFNGTSWWPKKIENIKF